MSARRWVVSGAAAALLLVGGAASAMADGSGTGVSGTDLPADAVGHSANVTHVANIPHSGPLTGQFGTDLAFQDGKAFVGNYGGFVVYDVTNPTQPTMISQVSCPGSQNDLSVHGNLLLLSTDSSRSDDSCSSTAQSATVKSSWEGIKIFDISDVRNPRYVKSVETACGSHTHTLVPGRDKKDVFVYVSSYSPSASYPDCQPPHDSITIIDVPVKKPTVAHVIDAPVLFPDGGNAGGPGRSATTGCHDITAYPAKHIAAGACMGDGIILDIKDPARPKVIDRVSDDQNFAFWHSATFNQDASKVVFTDEPGGGDAPTCDAATGSTRGANGIYDLSRKHRLTFVSYYKIPRMQGATENCVAHNGSLIPVKGKDLVVQSWYQGGVSVWDFTDSRQPSEIGYFERGALPGTGIGGTWSAYYYNGYVFSSDIAKGFDVLKIRDMRTDPAERVRMGRLNVQSQSAYR